MPTEKDRALLETEADRIVTFISVATSSSELLQQDDKAEFERAEATIVESRRRAESAAGSLKIC